MKAILLVLLILSLPLQLGRHFWPKESFLFGLRVDYLSPTLYLQDIFALPFIFIWLKNNQKYIFRRKFIFLLIFYILFLIFNIYSSLTPLVCSFTWLRISEMILFGLIISLDTAKVWRALERVLPLLILGEFFLGAFQVIKQASIGGIFWLLGEREFNIFTPGIAKASWLGQVFLRPYGTFSHPNSLAGFILVCLLLILGQKKLSILGKSAVIAGLVLIILSFSRTVWLVSLVLGLIYLGYKLLKHFQGEMQKLNFSYLVVVMFFLIFSWAFTQTTIEPDSFFKRRDLAVFALEVIQRSPLLGVGAGNFVVSLAQSQIVWPGIYWLQPVHNVFLLVGSETGLIGLTIFIVFLCLTIRRLLSCCDCYLVNKNQDNNFVGSHLSILIALLTILFTGLFDHYWLTLIQNQLLFVLLLSLSWGENKLG